MTGRTTNVAGQDIIPAQVERAQLTLRRTKTQDKRMSFGHQGSLRRRWDFARQRWPCGQHKKAVWRLAPTAAPRIPRVNLPMAAPFGLGSRRGICAYHRHCGTISFRQTRAPFGPHSDEDLRWRPGAPQACHFASVIANNLSIGNAQAASGSFRPSVIIGLVSPGRAVFSSRVGVLPTFAARPAVGQRVGAYWWMSNRSARRCWVGSMSVSMRCMRGRPLPPSW
jgi:hypothetical protein